MKKNITALHMIVLFFLLAGCAATLPQNSEEGGAYSLTDISDGLPADGFWRENMVLYDFDGDGFLDIAAPPPRKAKVDRQKPFAFLRDTSKKTWTDAKYSFPEKYEYGSIAVGDLNGDGRPDLALAQHGGNIALLLNDGKNNFTESPLETKEKFHSRGIVLSDINRDGHPDIIAASEAKFSGKYVPRGILVAINQEGKSWDVNILEDNSGLFADSIATGDIRGSGDKDIAVAFLTSIKESQKLIWFGDGKGGFQTYAGDILGDFSGKGAVPAIVRTGNVDRDVEDEVAFGLALIGRANEKGKLVVLKWTGEGVSDISSGLDLDGYLVAFDLEDIDGDGRDELVVLTETGLHIFEYNSPAGWKEQGHVSIPAGDIPNVTDLKVGKNKDGSVVMVYNLGKYETPGFNQGIKAYILNRKSLH